MLPEKKNKKLKRLFHYCSLIFSKKLFLHHMVRGFDHVVSNHIIPSSILWGSTFEHETFIMALSQPKHSEQNLYRISLVVWVCAHEWGMKKTSVKLFCSIFSKVMSLDAKVSFASPFLCSRQELRVIIIWIKSWKLVLQHKSYP